MNLNDAGAGSLRQAILDTPPGGTVDFQPGLSGTITLTSGFLLINHDLSIAGPGANVIAVSGNHASGVFVINFPSTVNISGLTIADGQVTGSSASGGGINNGGLLTITACTLSSNAVTPTNPMGVGGGGINNGSTGTLTLTSSILTNNSATGTVGSGGGIENSGTLTITSSTLSGNSATASGGGINNGGRMTITSSTLRDNVGGIQTGLGGGINNYGTLTIDSSTLSNNSADGFNGGGGVANSGTLTLTSSTLSGNSAQFEGGGIYSFNFGTLTITSSTLSGNSAASGGGIYRPSGVLTVKNTLLAANTAPASPDLHGPLISHGHNLIGDGTGGSGYDPTDLVGTSDNPIDPLLGPLQDNGGPTQTMALLPGSPAIDAGDNTDAPMWDQRGPGFRRIVDGTIDIGAFEVQAHAHGRPTELPLPDPVPVQALGTPGGSVLGQPPDLPGDPAPLPGAGGPAGRANLPRSGPNPAPTADGQAVDAVLGAAADQGQPGDAFGPGWESNLAPLAPNPLGGP
jgi:hypothetical protein